MFFAPFVGFVYTNINFVLSFALNNKLISNFVMLSLSLDVSNFVISFIIRHQFLSNFHDKVGKILPVTKLQKPPASKKNCTCSKFTIKH